MEQNYIYKKKQAKKAQMCLYSDNLQYMKPRTLV